MVIGPSDGDETLVSDSHVLQELKAKFATLSPQLRKASRFIIDNPGEVAMHSMRAMAGQAGVQPSVMIRLAKAMGFESYEPFREHFRSWMNSGTNSWEVRARRLATRAKSEESFVDRLVDSDIENVNGILFGENTDQLKKAVVLINNSRTVYVFGFRSMFSASYYFHYLMRLFSSKTVLITGIGGATADLMRDISARDALVIFSLEPYSRDAVAAAQFARDRQAGIIAVTDSKVSPVVTEAGPNIIVTNSTDALLPSALPAVAVAHVLATMVLVANEGEDAMLHLKRSTAQLEHFNVYVP